MSIGAELFIIAITGLLRLLFSPVALSLPIKVPGNNSLAIKEQPFLGHAFVGRCGGAVGISLQVNFPKIWKSKICTTNPSSGLGHVLSPTSIPQTCYPIPCV